MEHCAGGSLFDKLVAKGGITEDRARPLFRQIVESVEACHDNGIVHRDLKPENLLLDKSLKKITLIDFGLATYFVAVRNTTTCFCLRKLCGDDHCWCAAGPEADGGLRLEAVPGPGGDASRDLPQGPRVRGAAG